ncbi:hypothetical protein AMTRI_Chr01g130050 [Amborella trichopoda]
MHLCMKYFIYSCMLACCIYGGMRMLYVCCLCSSVSLHVSHVFITVHFGKRSRLFPSISVCNRSRLFFLLQVQKMLHRRSSKFYRKFKSHSCGESGECRSIVVLNVVIALYENGAVKSHLLVK